MLSCVMITMALKTAPVLSDHAEKLSLVLRIFESCIYSLMTWPSNLLHALVPVVMPIRLLGSGSIISTITHKLLTFAERGIQTHFCGNLAIREASTFKRTICPNDVSCLKTYPNLIPYTGSLELVRVPFMVKGRWFLDAEISPVDRNLAHTTIVAIVMVCPKNLPEYEETVDRMRSQRQEQQLYDNTFYIAALTTSSILLIAASIIQTHSQLFHKSNTIHSLCCIVSIRETSKAGGLCQLCLARYCLHPTSST